ncbi:MAG: ABC transporter permease [Candidatus Kapabacteria bacterium]|nr:ABC transporter permease [Candidatus Kapabacteria bacterium]
MSKISVIISHEYRTRVRAKWFIISTLLAPFGLALIIAVPVLAAVLAGDGAEGKVVVLDRTDSLGAAVVKTDTARYQIADDRTETQLAEAVKNEEIQAYVLIPSNILDSGKVTMYSRGGSGIAFESSVQEALEPLIVKARLQKVGTDTAVIDLVERGIDVVSLKVTDTGIEADASKASAMMGYMGGFMIYMLIFLYGTMVMRGVVEEKANRIIEVLASSARPFEIMMGKVIGIGLVGLTQLVLWFALGSLVMMGVGALLAPSMSPETMQNMQQLQASNPSQNMGVGGALASSGIVLPHISLVTILMFIFNFFAGYFLYASLFAAVGSAVDQESDANSLTQMVPSQLLSR